MNIAQVALLLSFITLFSGCYQQGGFSTTAPASRGVPILDPLPRLLDNLPGENHFSNIIQLTDGGDNRQPGWSPTGQELAFSSVRPPHSTSRRYVMAIDGSGLNQVSEQQDGDEQDFKAWAQRQPAEQDGSYSPDGSRICFQGYPDAGQEFGVKAYFGPGPPDGDGPEVLNLYIRDAAGSAVTEVLSNGAYNCAPCFAPDGEHIIFSSNLGGQDYDLYRISLAGKALEKITSSAGFDGDPAFSSDGRRLLFISQRNDEDPDEFNVFVADWLIDE